MDLRVYADAEALAAAAAELFRARVTAKPTLAIALPAGRTPRRMYAVMEAMQATAPADYSRVHVFGVDELCPPAPADGYFWRQITQEFLRWSNVVPAHRHPFHVAAADVTAMCRDHEATIAALGGLDVVMLGLGPNAHIGCHEPPADFASRTCPVRLLPETVAYIRTDDVTQGKVSDTAVTLGVRTILEAREVVLLVSGATKRRALHAMLHGPITPDVPASILQRHANCVVLADQAAIPD